MSSDKSFDKPQHYKQDSFMPSNNLIPIRSEAMQEIISRNTSFFERWAILFIFIITLTIFLGTWFIKYPDVISVHAKLVSINAPKEVKTKLDGRLVKLNVVEEQTVKEFEVIGMIESRANHEEVIALSKYIDSAQVLLSNNKIDIAVEICSKHYLHLGEIQQAFQTFMQSHQLFKQYLKSGFFFRKKNMLQKDMSFLKKLDSVLIEQEKLQIEDIQLTKETFSANEKLKDERIISSFDYRNEKSNLINKQMRIPQLKSSIIINQSLQHDKQKEIMELDNQIKQQKNIFCEALNTLKSQLDEWKAKYLLIAPIAGKVSFVSFLEQNQQLQNNQSICFINPSNSEFYAQIFIPQTNFGKIKKGQTVLLKFPSYPFEEFGYVTGNLEFISPIPTDSGFSARVLLPNGLLTNYNKNLQFNNGLKANGEIITENMRILERFFYQFKKAIKQRN
jgi:multidrug efflux pump subunit AcrA (membrane-fusion protein)